MLKPISVQLYSLREMAEKDFVGVLKKVADIGYVGVEPAGLWGLEPKEFLKIIDDLGLKMFSSHTPWARVNNLDETMEMANALGLKKIVCGYGPDDFKDMDAIKKTAESTCKIYETVSKNGFTLFQHNHDFEFQRIDGKLKYQIYRELCPSEVKIQMDCFWSTCLGKEDSVEMLKIFKDDVISIHMKDGISEQKVAGDDMVNGLLERKVELMPLGTGTLPIKELVKEIPEQVDTIIVELDSCIIDMMTAIELSYKFMTLNGLAQGNK